MKYAVLGLLALIVGGVALISVNQTPTPPMQQIIDDSENVPVQNPDWPEVIAIDHASFILRWGDHVIYNDPVGDAARYVVHGAPTHIILTHSHPDHLDFETLAALPTDIPLVVPPEVFEKLPPERQGSQTIVMQNDDVRTIDDMTLTAIPMYNISEGKTNFHVKGVGNGYVIERAGVRVYNASDTEATPEFRSQQNIDIAFVPMNEPFTMDVAQAADGVLELAPKVVYPYHYRGREGFSDVEEFTRLVQASNPAINVQLLDWYGNDAENNE